MVNSFSKNRGKVLPESFTPNRNLKYVKNYATIRHRKRREDLTYILGARCKDGVVLVGDRKVLRGNVPAFKGKLFKILPNVIMGGAGTNAIIDRFLGEIVTKVNGGEIKTDEEFLRYVEDRSLELQQRYFYRVGELQILFAMRPTSNSQLYNLDTQSGVAEPIIRDYMSIGSGEPHGALFLKGLWKPEMTMIDFAKLGYFLIRHIERLKLDDSVGGDPQIWFMPDITTNVKSADEGNEKFPIREATKEEMKSIDKDAFCYIIKTDNYISSLVNIDFKKTREEWEKELFEKMEAEKISQMPKKDSESKKSQNEEKITS